MKKLAGLEGNSFAEAIAELYGGKLVEIYFGENSGTNYYAEYDVEQKVFTLGYIIGAVGDLILFEAITYMQGQEVRREMAVNCWSVTAIMPKTDIKSKLHISHFFGELKR